jgi:acetyl-CoA C-acetyltransferase
MDRARSGYRMDHGRLLDHMFLDGLEDAYEKGRLMGTYAEDCAQSYAFTREAQDEYASASLARAKKATADGSFAPEIVPVTVNTGKTQRQVNHDELPLKATPDKIPHLKPVFREGGTVTAANSSAISDGAAALVLMPRSEADRRGLKPLATIAGHASYASTPALFPTAPIGAIRRLLYHTGWAIHDVDFFRNQRSLRCRRHGGHARSRSRSREGQHPRRRLRARPPHWRIRRAHSRHASRRPREIQTPPRHRLALHRRRRSDRHGN